MLKTAPKFLSFKHKKGSGNSFIKTLLVITLLALIVSRTLAYWVNRQYEANIQLVSHTMHVIDKGTQLLSSLKDAETAQRGYILSESEEFLSPYASAKDKLRETSLFLKENTSEQEAVQQALNKLLAAVEAKMAALENTISLVNAEGFETAVQEISRPEGRQLMEEAKRQLEAFRAVENVLLSERRENLRELAAMAEATDILFGLFTIGIILYAIYTINKQEKTRRHLFAELDRNNREHLMDTDLMLEKEEEIINSLIRNLKDATSFVQEIGRENYQAELRGVTKENSARNTRNLAGALLRMRDTTQETSLEEEKRNWVNEGMAKFAEILRSRHELSQLLDTLIAEQVKYMGANQGALFLVNEESSEEVFLEMKACYAYNRKKFLNKKVAIGEGLVGQVYLEQEYIYLTEIPQNYVQITSGLGEATPRSILVLPLMSNEKINGVIELASFKEFRPHEIEFCQKIAETISSTLSSFRINERTKQLLQESQQQTEEMRAQEEEVRQNMEELEATQEEMRRQEIEIRGQLSAVNNTLASVEFDLQGNIQQANDTFLRVMGYTLEEIRGVHHSLFCEPSYASSPDYRAFWEKLNQGKSVKGEFKRLTKLKQEVWLQASYTPVLDERGKAVKILKYAFEITEEKKNRLNLQGKLEAINLSNAVIEFTPGGEILQANPIFLQLMGYTEEQLKGKHHRMFVSEEEQASEAYASHWKTLAQGKNIQGEFERVNSRGETIWIRGTYAPVFDLNDQVTKIVKVAQDITENKKLAVEMQEKLQENTRIQKDLDAYLKALDGAALMSESDLYGNIINVNDRFCEVAKYSREEVMGKPHNILRHPDNSKELFKEMWDTIKAGKIFKGRYPNRAKDGSTYWVEATIEPVLGPDGKPEKYIGIRFDITEQVEKEAEVTKLMKDLDTNMWQMKMKEEELREYIRELEKAEKGEPNAQK